jgi:ElaB/YqjD/DUF883 family membrane-anchored ribosome-binding protein
MSGNWDQSRGNRRGLQDRFSSTFEDARDRIGEVGSMAQHQVDRARTGFEQMLEEQPLVLGAVAMALGAVLGATLPTTRVENRYLGPTRDTLQDRVGEYARDQWQRAKSVVSSAGSAAMEQAEKEGIVPSSMAEQVKGKARRVADAATNAAQAEADRQRFGGSGTGQS